MAATPLEVERRFVARLWRLAERLLAFVAKWNQHARPSLQPSSATTVIGWSPFGYALEAKYSMIVGRVVAPHRSVISREGAAPGITVKCGATEGGVRGMSYFLRGAIEVRIRQSKVWSALAPIVDVDDPQNKLFFRFLAGGAVEFDMEPVAQPRGLPEDVSGAVRRVHEEWGDLAEDTSWVTWFELMSTVEKIQHVAATQLDAEEFIRDQIGLSIQAIAAYMTVYEVHGWSTRFIFWRTTA